MDQTKKTMRSGLRISILSSLVIALNSYGQILHVDSIMVDSIWNSDTVFDYGNGMSQKRVSRDCRISFFLKGEGTAKIFLTMSFDSGRTWGSSARSYYILGKSLNSTFNVGQKTSLIIRINGGDTTGVAFKITARQSAPLILRNSHVYWRNVINPPIPGEADNISLKIKIDSMLTGGFCPIEKVYWKAFGNNIIEDSTTGLNAFAWVWHTVVPEGESGQRRHIVVRVKDKNGLLSLPETLYVQFGLVRPIVMKNIPGGTFSMGDSSVGAFPVHQVTLSSFLMQETDVTLEQYIAVMDTNPSSNRELTKPIAEVTWYGAVKYCNALSLLAGLETVYDTITWTADFTKNGYRLPTEAQYEYACRAGTTTIYWWGPDTNGMGKYSWTWYNTPTGTSVPHPVATKTANKYGLYDITGNVWQWCNDWYWYYTASSVTNPTGGNNGTYRVKRGGSWYDSHIGYFTTAFRWYGSPDSWSGFRLVLPQ